MGCPAGVCFVVGFGGGCPFFENSTACVNEPVFGSCAMALSACGLDLFGVCGWLVVWGLVCVCLVGEFDPGSGRTLAACLTHASRAERPASVGARAANG